MKTINEKYLERESGYKSSKFNKLTIEVMEQIKIINR